MVRLEDVSLKVLDKESKNNSPDEIKYKFPYKLYLSILYLQIHNLAILIWNINIYKIVSQKKKFLYSTTWC